MANYVSYNDLAQILGVVGQKLNAVNGAYVYKGSIAFASIPVSLTPAMNGFVYNITNDFTTDARFLEGAGKKYSAGTNVVVTDQSTYDAATPEGSEDPSSLGWYELVSDKYVASADTTVDSNKTYYVYTASVKLDINSSFVDVDALEAAIDAVKDNIADEFDETAAYAIGDIVVYEDNLYKFKAAHAAGVWASADVDRVTVDDLIKALEASIAAVNGRVNTVVSDLADAFDATQAYAIGDVVTYQDGLYKFKAAHTPDDPWSVSEVDAITVEDIVSAAEPESLTAEQISALTAIFN